MKKIKVRVGKFIRYCSGVLHQAWYESYVGVIRKPIQGPIYPGQIIPVKKIKKVSWWKRLLLFIKKILKWQR